MGIMSMDDITGGTAGVASGLEIGSFNCNGLGNTAKRNSVLTWLKGKRAWGGEVLFNHGASNSTGVVMLIKHGVKIKIVNQVDIILGRATLLEVEYDSIKYCLVNVYGPNNDDIEFLKKVCFLKS